MKIILGLLLMITTQTALSESDLLIDDFSGDRSALGSLWRLVTDGVMGGVSRASAEVREVDGRRALCLQGTVSLDNNGGFVQVNLDLASGGYFDASGFAGVRFLVRGNGEVYNLHLKTAATQMPWQSYRAEFIAGPNWTEVQLPFRTFEPHRLVPRLDPRQLRRIALVAIGRRMQADLCVTDIGFYAENN